MSHSEENAQQDSPSDLFETAIERILSQPGFKERQTGLHPYADSIFPRVSRQLELAGKPTWSYRPRTYTLLRLINRLDALNGFIAEGLFDISLPYTERTLPAALRNPSARAKFLELQHLVLSPQAASIENDEHLHRHFGVDGDIHFVPFKKLGSGAFGQVDHVWSRLSANEYARKRIPRGRTFQRDKQAVENFERELRTLKQLSHRHLVSYVGSYSDPRFVAILMAPVADMNLMEYLKIDPFPIDQLANLRHYFGCLTSALVYLHGKKIRHKDIKPHNILVHGDNVLITDFGTSLDWSDRSRSTTQGKPIAFTPKYCAPEVREYMCRNSSADIYSLGYVFLEMSTVLRGETLDKMKDFVELNTIAKDTLQPSQEAEQMWIEHLRPNKRHLNDDEPLEWAADMLKRNPGERPNAFDLYNRIQLSTGNFIGACCSDEFEEAADSSYAGSVCPAMPVPIPERLGNSTFKQSSPKDELRLSQETPVHKLLSELGPSYSYSNVRPLETALEVTDQISRENPFHHGDETTLDELGVRNETKTTENYRHGLKLDAKENGNWISVNNNSSISELEESDLQYILSSVEGYEEKEGSILDENSELIERHNTLSLDEMQDILEQDEDESSQSSKSSIMQASKTHTEDASMSDKEPGSDVMSSSFGVQDEFIVAARAGDVPAMRLLLERGASVNFPNSKGYTALYCAAAHGKHLAVDMLLSEGADFAMECEGFGTALGVAAVKGHSEVVKLLINGGADVNQQGIEGWTALLLAVHRGHTTTAQALLENGANPNMQNNHRSTPLAIASTQGHDQLVRLLLDHKASIIPYNKHCHGKALHLASAYGHCSVMEILLNRGMKVDSSDFEGNTATHDAASCGQLCSVRFLLDLGADVNFKNSSLEVPLHLAASEGHLEVTELLLERGANVDSKNSCLETPLHLASMEGHLEVVKLLIERGGNVDSKNSSLETPLHLATVQGHLGVVELLLLSRADVFAPTRAGVLSKQLAEEGGHDQIAKLIMERESSLTRLHRSSISRWALEETGENFDAMNGYYVVHRALTNEEITKLQTMTKWHTKRKEQLRLISFLYRKPRPKAENPDRLH